MTDKRVEYVFLIKHVVTKTEEEMKIPYIHDMYAGFCVGTIMSDLQEYGEMTNLDVSYLGHRELDD